MKTIHDFPTSAVIVDARALLPAGVKNVLMARSLVQSDLAPGLIPARQGEAVRFCGHQRTPAFIVAGDEVVDTWAVEGKEMTQ